MNAGLNLALLLVLMAATSYGAGILLLHLPLTAGQLNVVSVLSMGMLIGTLLAIVVPEGIETLYASGNDLEAYPKYIGLSLLVGFMVMFFIDNIQVVLESLNVGSPPRRNHDSVGQKLGSLVRTPLTLGLILHLAVDGISLGSSFTKDDITLGVIFFVMIIIHKLPTAFSLVTLLAKDAFPKLAIAVHLAVFSAMTPVASLVTYFVLLATAADNDFAIGILLLLSGGTFIYIVTHVMLHVLTEDRHDYRPQTNDSEETLSEKHTALLGLELLVSLVGMAIPVVISIFGHH